METVSGRSEVVDECGVDGERGVVGSSNVSVEVSSSVCVDTSSILPFWFDCDSVEEGRALSSGVVTFVVFDLLESSNSNRNSAFFS